MSEGAGISPGTAVLPANGRFKGRPMVVLSIRDGYAEICDGKKKRLLNPKRKKLCHLIPISGVKSLTLEGVTDGAVRRYLRGIADAHPDN